MKCIIYKITYPNGKIYVDKDLTNTLKYFGSVKSEYVAKDFTEEEMKDFTIRKEIIYEADNKEEINKIESKLILQYESNNPKICYNKWPKFKG